MTRVLYSRMRGSELIPVYFTGPMWAHALHWAAGVLSFYAHRVSYWAERRMTEAQR